MSCSLKCRKTASVDSTGCRIMVSVAGNEKFPTPHTPHSQCPSCEKADIAEALAQIAKAFPNSEIGLNARFEAMKKKLNK